MTGHASGTFEVKAKPLPADEKGEGYDSTSYSATLTVFVPDVCPCCGE